MKAFPWTRSACATRTLTSRCFADWSYEQRLHADSRIVDFLLAESWIDHIHNPVDCDRSLRDIRRNHHFPASFRRGLKHKLLLLGRKRGEERQDLEREKQRTANTIRFCLSFGKLACSSSKRSQVSMISCSPVRKSRMSPGSSSKWIWITVRIAASTASLIHHGNHLQSYQYMTGASKP